jgi:hypothetical protein
LGKVSAVLARIVLALGLLSVGVGGVATPALGASSGAYQAVLHAYESQGQVPPCQFSGVQLERALQGVDAYGAQYFADFTQAIQTALSVRASGSCSAAPAAATPTRVAGPVTPPARFGPVIAATGAGIPAPLAVLGGLLLAVSAIGTGLMVWARRRQAPAAPSGTPAPPAPPSSV